MLKKNEKKLKKRNEMGSKQKGMEPRVMGPLFVKMGASLPKTNHLLGEEDVPCGDPASVRRARTTPRERHESHTTRPKDWLCTRFN